jgi:hypothetical protein
MERDAGGAEPRQSGGIGCGPGDAPAIAPQRKRRKRRGTEQAIRARHRIQYRLQ